VSHLEVIHDDRYDAAINSVFVPAIKVASGGSSFISGVTGACDHEQSAPPGRIPFRSTWHRKRASRTSTSRKRSLLPAASQRTSSR
jgi:hypothetical protein